MAHSIQPAPLPGGRKPFLELDQLDLFDVRSEARQMTTLSTEDLLGYDIFYIAFSGGKDSLAMILHLLELGVPRNRIELHHHLPDGREGEHLMDWPVTESYCRAVAAHLGLPIYMSWKEGGFEREMLRDNQPTAATLFETPDGRTLRTGGDSGKLGTRRKFPQTSASLSARWCSSYTKISPCAASINGQPRFHNRRTLVVTGERAEESANRAKYAKLETHRTDARAGRLKRHVDQYRIILDWSERQVWEIIERWSIRPHAAYVAGWGRLSCAACIFGNQNQWATVAMALPEQFGRIQRYEAEFKVTIHRTLDVGTLAASGTPYPTATPDILQIARQTEYTLPILMTPWELPAGAYGDKHGAP